jgi:hypothetical protein
MIGRRRHLRPLCLAAALGVISASAWAQAVTLSDIEGTLVEVRYLRQQTIIRDGREFSNQFQNDYRLSIGANGDLTITGVGTSYSKRGVRRGKGISGQWKLEQAQKTKWRGGGHGVWLFADGTLTFLRTYKGGALKRTIAFAHGAKGLTCKATESLVREVGVAGIVLESGVDGRLMTIVSSKQISSSCRVTTQGQAAIP